MSDEKRTTITDDERSYLATLAEQEQTTITALRMARQSYEGHLAKKYSLVEGDQINPDGTIVRRAPSETGPKRVLKPNGQARVG